LIWSFPLWAGCTLLKTIVSQKYFVCFYRTVVVLNFTWAWSGQKHVFVTFSFSLFEVHSKSNTRVSFQQNSHSRFKKRQFVQKIS
jgi:hypothetical protein